jgi:cytochrome c
MVRSQLLVGLMLISAGISACGDSMPEPDPAAVQRGQQLSVSCTSCHPLRGRSHGIGPVLTSIVGRKAGSMEGYSYSPAMKAKNFDWTPDTIASFIQNPSEYVPGTKMALAPISEQDAKDIASYLQAATR